MQAVEQQKKARRANRGGANPGAPLSPESPFPEPPSPLRSSPAATPRRLRDPPAPRRLRAEPALPAGGLRGAPRGSASPCSAAHPPPVRPFPPRRRGAEPPGRPPHLSSGSALPRSPSGTAAHPREVAEGVRLGWLCPRPGFCRGGAKE